MVRLTPPRQRLCQRIPTCNPPSQPAGITRMQKHCYLIVVMLCGIVFSHNANAEKETLLQAFAAAYQNNPSLEAERASLRVTDEQVSQALSHWKPSIDATANAGKTWQRISSQGNFSGETHGGGIQLTQPVFRGFRTLAETEFAKKQVLAGRARLQHAEQQLFTDIASVFLGLLRDQAIMAAQRENEAVLARKLTEVRVRFQMGDLTRTDVKQAEARLARAGASRLQAEQAIVVDRATYQRLVGHLPGHLDAANIVLELPKTLDEALAKSAHNPDVMTAEYSEQAAQASVGYNEGSLLPEVNLVASSSRNWGQNITFPGREDSSQVLLQATVPLYRSGADYSRIRAAVQTVSQKKMESTEARHKAEETTHTRWQAMLTADTMLEANKAQSEAAREAFEGVKIESHAGTRTTLDVLNAQQEWLDAQIDMAKIIYDQQMAKIQMKAAIGELSGDFIPLPTPKYDATQHYDAVKGQWIGF